MHAIYVCHVYVNVCGANGNICKYCRIVPNSAMNDPENAFAQHSRLADWRRTRYAQRSKNFIAVYR